MTGAPLRLACLLVVLGGCSFAPADRAASNSCDRSRDCASGEMCDADLGRCVSDQSAKYDVVLRVSAPASELGPAAPPTRFGPITLDAPVIERDLTVKGIAPLRGLVAVKSEEPGAAPSPIAVELLLTPTKVGAGPPAETLSVMSQATMADGKAPNFATSLRSGIDYAVSVQPVGESVARVPPRSFVVTAEEIEDGFLEIIYDRLEEVTGRLLTVDGIGQEGLSVRMVDAEGQPLSSRTVSDLQGRFTLVLDGPWDAEAQEWGIELGPSSLNPWFGYWVAGPDDVGLDESGLISVGLPHLPERVRVEGSVERKSTLERVGAATATFVSDVELRRRDGSFTTLRVNRSVESEALGSVERPIGRLEVDLWPGVYDVLITPPAEDIELGVLRQEGFQVVLQPPGLSQKGATFSLPGRSYYGGVVRDGDGRALTAVTARSIALLPDADLPEVAAQNRGATVTTGDMGVYRLPVDVGRYDLVFEPGMGSGYPWWVKPQVRVNGRSRDVRKLDVDLVAPVVLTGTLKFDNGRSAVGAVVAAFAAVTDDSDEERYVQIGRATVREGGLYQLYLPPVQPGSE